MAKTTVANSYAEAAEALNRALNSDKGIKIKCSDHGMAVLLRQRMNKYRLQDRRDNLVVYPEGHPLHGASAFDCLVLRVKDEYVLVEKREPEHLEIEEL